MAQATARRRSLAAVTLAERAEGLPLGGCHRARQERIAGVIHTAVQRRPEVGLRVAWAGSASSGASCRKYSRRGWTSILPEASTAFERESGHAEGAVGEATATLASQRRLVDFAAEWFEANR